ncbi:MAG: NAD-dependent epimerase/dehydratase family protein [Elusimicrobiota bacterium]
MEFYKNKRVLVAGGGGFVGSFLVEKLIKNGAKVFVCGSRPIERQENLGKIIKEIEYRRIELTNKEDTFKLTKNIDYVFALAARVGGVEYNSKHPGSLFYNNVLPNLLLLESSRINNVDRYLCVSTACVYPADAAIPTHEEEGFEKYPEYTNRGYGWSKRVIELQSRFYYEEYGMKIAIVRPFNIYGPRDNFEPEKSHVIPALIKKVMEAKSTIEVWGTGKSTRAFLYAEDAVRGMLLALEKYAVADPVNLGADDEISIADLIKMIVKLSNRKLKIKFLKDKPEGQPRRSCDITKANKILGFKTKISLEEGLKKTIAWYKENYGK